MMLSNNMGSLNGDRFIFWHNLKWMLVPGIGWNDPKFSLYIHYQHGASQKVVPKACSNMLNINSLKCCDYGKKLTANKPFYFQSAIKKIALIQRSYVTCDLWPFSYSIFPLLSASACHTCSILNQVLGLYLNYIHGTFIYSVNCVQIQPFVK